MKRFLKTRVELLGFAAGLLLFCAGLGLAWPPLGLIGAGGMLMALSLFGGDES